MKNTTKRWIKSVIYFSAILITLYASGRLYYQFTGGFTESNISYALPYDSKWNTHSLSDNELKNIHALLDLKYSYLGKGCQSYVFVSEDGEYVLKFFKYQRFRPKAWLSYITFLPGMENYMNKKIAKKKEKLDSVFISWKIAYENLQPETAVAYVHLNKTQNLNKKLIIFDKMGFKHVLDMDNYEFMIQYKANMLCPTLSKLANQNKIDEAKEIIHKLILMILSEYHRGYADNDHALMQNTGVLNGRPIHIDAGQFVRNQRVTRPDIYHQEIFNKTWKFRKWLEKHHPELAEYLNNLLQDIIGKEKFAALKPQLNKADVGIISHDTLD